MRRLVIAALLVGSFIHPALADSTPGGQLLLSLVQHVVGITEFTTEGKTKLEFIDGLVQAGHYKDDYVVALDGGFCNSVSPDTNGHLATTWGIHAHVFSLINSYFDINPELAKTLTLLELTPRYSYDADVHHGVLGFTFGARIPF